jgi:diaminopimelate decarboxylase
MEQKTSFVATETARLVAIAQRYGTPTYVYSEAKIAAQYRALDKALHAMPHTICYAVKANSNLTILKMISELGAGFDTVSGGEIARVAKSVGTTQRTVFAGVGKTQDEIDYALKKGVLFFSVESAQELSLIEARAKALGIVAPISFRVNPDIPVATHPYIATGMLDSKFGIAKQDLTALAEQAIASPHLSLVALSCHLGSQLHEAEPFFKAYEDLFALAAQFSALGAPIAYIDGGGGFGVSFSGHYTPLSLEHLGAGLAKLFSGTPYHLIVEPGKYLVAESGILLTTVQYVKKNAVKNHAVVDAGMNDLIRPALYNGYHHIVKIGDAHADSKDTDSKYTEQYDIVGPVCESACFLGKERMLPPVAPGDLLAVCDVGAYGFTMASNYNSRCRPAEVLIRENGDIVLIGKRETESDLWDREVI